MKKNYTVPNCELLDLANVIMIHVSAEMNEAEDPKIIFGSGGNYDGELFK